MKTWVTGLLLFVLIAGGGGLLLSWHYENYLSSGVGQAGLLRKVTIPKGTDLAMTIEILHQENLLRMPLYFKLHAMSTGKGRRIRPGVYYFDLGHSPLEIMDELIRGPEVPYLKVVVPEGSNIWDIAKIVQKTGLGSEEDFLAMARDRALLEKLGAKPSNSLDILYPAEGWLFPETYFLEPGQSLEDLFAVMVKQCRRELAKAKKSQLAEYAKLLSKMELSDSELLSIASMAEAEAILSYEKKLVASVFYNRLEKGMPLQSDPTLTYSDKRKGAVPTKRDRLNKKNKYNSYTNMGLPPGPIGNPGREAIAAAVAPARSRFFYFVAKRDGSHGHHFSITYKEHLKAVNKYLKGK